MKRLFFLAVLTVLSESGRAQTPGGMALPDTSVGIHRGLVFDSKIKDHTVEQGQIDIVWGAERAEPSSVFTMAYYPFTRDRDGGLGGKSHDVAWFKANHPDWIAYTCDRTTPAFEFDKDNPGRYAPLDITNPDVLQYMVDQYIAGYIAKGYQAIAFDNVSFRNDFKRCGIWRDGQWIQQFSGEPKNDPAFVKAVLDWARWMHPKVHSLGGKVAINFARDFSIRNFDEVARELLADVDIVLDEGGSTDIGNGTGTRSEADWIANTEFERSVVDSGKALFIVNYLNVPHYSYNKTDAREAMQWVVANYLLVKGATTYVYASALPDVGGLADHPEYSLAVGAAVSRAYRLGSVHARDYSNARVFVNPSPENPAAVEIGADGYCDAAGRPARQVEMAPQSGAIVLKCAP